MMLKYNLGTKYTTNANLAMMRGIRNSSHYLFSRLSAFFIRTNIPISTNTHMHQHRANLEHKSTRSLIKYMLCVVLCSLSSALKANSSVQSPAGGKEGPDHCQYMLTYIKRSSRCAKKTLSSSHKLKLIDHINVN